MPPDKEKEMSVAALLATKARLSARAVASASTEQKNMALAIMAEKLKNRLENVLEANNCDLQAAGRRGTPVKMLNRLSFGAEKIKSRIRALREIVKLPDPVGSSFGQKLTKNGLGVSHVRIPLGVILMIYEARPHVTVNGGALCLKSGNAVILRGGSEAKSCNRLLGDLWRESLCGAGLPAKPFKFSPVPIEKSMIFYGGPI